MKNCCFTGHRTLSIDDNSIGFELEKALLNLIDNGIENFYAGGALGWDTVCALKITELQKTYPHIKLILILPCPPEEQTNNWSETEKIIYYHIINSADSIEYVCEHYCNGCMKKRNQTLVNNADICLAYFNPKRIRSGTS